MFFFEFPVEQADGLTPSLIGELNDVEIDLKNIRGNLQKETEKQGLRNNDLAELTGWSKSKISKILAGKQNMTTDDIRVWARALGYTPDPFIDNGVDFRKYALSSYIRPVGDVMEAFFAADNDKIAKGIMLYEFPLAILLAIGVNASDYAIRANISTYGINLGSKAEFGESADYVRFWQRTTKEEGKMTPEFGIWISPGHDYFFFAVYLNGTDAEQSVEKERVKYKDLLQIEETNTEEFDNFARRNEDWIPSYVINGEVFAFGADTNNLPYPEQVANVFIELFKKYCSLVWEYKGIDLLPERLKEREELTVYDQYSILNGNAKFDLDVVERVKSNQCNECEYDNSHESFIEESGRRYMEIVPLIPFTHGTQYGKSIMSEANAICLCPNCKAEIVHGQSEKREDMIMKLYRKHKEALLEAGIDMPFSQVLNVNNL